MLTDDAWWALLVSTLIELTLKGLTIGVPYTSAAVFGLTFALMLAIYYAIMRSMHRFLWVRWYSITAAVILAILPAAMSTLAMASYFTQERINSTVDAWGVVMRNPQCWARDAAGEYERRMSKAGAETETIDGLTYARLAPAADPNSSLAASNNESFTASAKVIASMAEDAFLQDFPTLAPFANLDTEKALKAFAGNSYSFWSLPPSAKGEGEQEVFTRKYTAESLAPFVTTVTTQAKEATPRIAYSMLTITAVLTLLCALPGIAVVFFDLDYQIRKSIGV